MLGLPKNSRFHFIGIGGIGMSGIAEVLLDLGYQISGSDTGSSTVTEHLKEKGARIFLGHSANQVEGSSAVVYSTAIDPKNPEFVRAKELSLPLIRRGEMLAELMKSKFGLAIAGSHGKTTTSSLVATIFKSANLDATHIIGGLVKNLGGNAQKGDSQYFIAEADESDGSFLKLHPVMTVVTNIDNDHLDHYGSQEKITNAFVEFMNQVPAGGKVVLNLNDANSVKCKSLIKSSMIWFGINIPEADYHAHHIDMSAEGSFFDLSYQGEFIRRIQTHQIGMHNISNTLGAIALCHEAGIDWDVIQKGLLQFQGVGRRLEQVYKKDSFLVLDDYGHHPTEVLATISALKKVDKRPLCVVFEPHRFTRTQNFWKEFQECFPGVDELFISPIYAASEAPITGITSQELVRQMKEKGVNVTYIEGLQIMDRLLRERQHTSGIFLTLGAGAISKKVRDLVGAL